MSVAEQLDRIVSPDEAVELIWQEVLAGGSADTAAAARVLWPHFRFKQDDLDFLALLGLAELAAREQRHARSGVGRPGIGYGAPHGKNWAKYIALTWPYEGADGSQRALIDFTLDDLSFFALRAGKLEATWRDRKKWATSTAEVLKEHSVERVRDLPVDALAAVNEAALEAMGRKE